MSISRYKSVKHVTRNEKGNEEIEIVYEKTLWQLLLGSPAMQKSAKLTQDLQ